MGDFKEATSTVRMWLTGNNAYSDTFAESVNLAFFFIVCVFGIALDNMTMCVHKLYKERNT